MNRRQFLRMAGIAGAGTLAGERLMWLARQPTSVINNMYPYTQWVEITGLGVDSEVTLYHNHSPLWQTINGVVQPFHKEPSWIARLDVVSSRWDRKLTVKEGEPVRLPVLVNGPRETEVTVIERSTTPMPKSGYENERNACASIIPEGGPEVFSVPAEWEAAPSRHTSVWQLRRDEELQLTNSLKYPTDAELEFTDF